MYRRRNTTSRKSVWDVDRVFLKELLGNFSSEEQMELEGHFDNFSVNNLECLNEEPSMTSTIDRASKSPQVMFAEAEDTAGVEAEAEAKAEAHVANGIVEAESENVETVAEACAEPACEEPAPVATVEAETQEEAAKPEPTSSNADSNTSEVPSLPGLDIANRRDGPSMMNFGKIAPDTVVNVYHEKRRMSMPHNHSSGMNPLEILEIPGLVIEHTTSQNFRDEACVDEREKSSTSESESETEELINLEHINSDNTAAVRGGSQISCRSAVNSRCSRLSATNMSHASINSAGKQSSYEVLVIPNRESGEEVSVYVLFWYNSFIQPPVGNNVICSVTD